MLSKMTNGLRKILIESEKDPSFIDDLLKNKSLSKNNELVSLLSQGRDTGFSDSLLKYMFHDYENIIKEATIVSLHPALIKHVREYTISKGIDHRNIAQHIFPDGDYFFDYFASYRKIALDTEEKKKIVERGFDQGSMLLGASFVYASSDNLYMQFSKIKKNPSKDGLVTIDYINKNFSRAKWEGLEEISTYLDERFPDKSIFEILRLDPNDVL